jgi:hypothetical protein
MRSWAACLAAVASAAILLLGVRAFLDPLSASAGFGLPMHTDDEATFVRIYGARNAFLGALALAFLWFRMAQPLTLLFALATVLPVLDAVVIVSRIGVGQELLRHAAILLVLAIVSLSLWRSTRAHSADEILATPRSRTRAGWRSRSRS